MTPTQRRKLQRRLRDPKFWAALAGLIYQALQKYGADIDAGQYQALVDLISYALIGTGIYSIFTPPEEKKATKHRIKSEKAAAKAAEPGQG